MKETTQYSLGSILLKEGLVTQSQLNAALQKQSQQAEIAGWQRLGEILVEARLISQKDLRAALEQQSKLIEAEFFSTNYHPSTRNWLKRSLDIAGAIAGLGVMVALLPMIAIALYLEVPGPIFVARPRIGLRGRQFKQWQFRTTTLNAQHRCLSSADGPDYNGLPLNDGLRITRVGKIFRWLYLDQLPQFLNVLRGEMSLVGVQAVTLDAVKLYTANDWQRLSVKPGMTGVWYIQRNSGAVDALARDMAYVNHWQNLVDLRILITSLGYLVSRKKHHRVQRSPLLLRQNQVAILNVPIDNISMRELLEQLRRGIVLTPNVDHLMKLQKDQEFYQVYAVADYKVCDSQILMYASRFLGTPLKEKVSGSDFFPGFCEFHKANEEITVFLLGGAVGVADLARERINRRVGRNLVIGSHSPSFGFEKNEQECLEIVEMINQSQATVLAIGVGAPKQEKWIYRYKDRLPNVKIFLAIGATIDFEAGVVKRSPRWVSKLGLEWLFRIASDPKRLWKRYLMDDLPFFWLLFQQKFGLYQLPFKAQALAALQESMKTD